MTASLVFTVLGADRPGLVKAIAKVVSQHGGNWEASHMSRLGGRFAGIVQVRVDPEKSEALAASLRELGPEGLQVSVEYAGDDPSISGPTYFMELMGSDQPNVVRDISAALAECGVLVLELTSELHDAPMAGGKFFKLHASIQAPEDLDRATLRSKLEELANSLMVDLRLED